MNRSFIFSLAALGAVGCGRVVDGTKNALNKGGELAGSAATEVIEGVATGVEKSWSVETSLSDELIARGLILGRTLVEADSAGTNNRLVLYLSTEKEFSDTLVAVVYGKDGMEMGRTTLALVLPANHGDHHTLQFQALTDLGRKSRVLIR